MAQAARTMSNASGRRSSARPRLLIINGGDPSKSRSLQTVAEGYFGGRVLWIDDHIPEWLTADFDTYSEYYTHARNLIELHVCSRAQRFVGTLASSSTHAVCQLRDAAASHTSSGAKAKRCADALGRRLVAGAHWSFF